MKTVSTKLDSKSHEYLIDLANKNGTTVSDVLRDMVDQLIQNEGMVDETHSDDERRREIGRLESELGNLDRLLDQDISEEKRKQFLEQNRKLEDKLSNLLDAEYNLVENSLLDVFGYKSWFSHSDEFVDFVKRNDVSILEALNSAMGHYLEHLNKIDPKQDPAQISFESCVGN